MKNLRVQDAKGHAPALREIKAAPFCWQHKAALRLIRDSFDAEKTVASAIGVYVALTEIASDAISESFTTTHGWIAQKSGLSPRTVEARLPGLVQVCLVRISTPALKCPSTYQLLPVPQPLRDVPQRTKKAPSRASEESKNKSLEEFPKKVRFKTGKIDVRNL